LAIKLISPTQGQTTAEQILDLVKNYPEGITIRELGQKLNRPVSMLNYCLKSLLGSKKIKAKYDRTNQQWIYYSS
jgi:predicted transcriptional regulator